MTTEESLIDPIHDVFSPVGQSLVSTVYVIVYNPQVIMGALRPVLSCQPVSGTLLKKNKKTKAEQQCFNR